MFEKKAVLMLLASVAFASGLFADPIPDDPYADLKKRTHIYTFDRSGGFEDWQTPFLRIDNGNGRELLPPGTCSIRFKDIDVWYWGNPGKMVLSYPDLNGNMDLLYTGYVMTYDFVVWNLPYPECEGEPISFQVPLSGSGNWPAGATLLEVQTVEQMGYLATNVEFLDANGVVVEPVEPVEPDEPFDEDPCEQFPHFFVCDEFELPCFLDPDGCEDAESNLQLTLKAWQPMHSSVAHLKTLQALFAKDPSHAEIPRQLTAIRQRLDQATDRFGEVEAAFAEVERDLALRPWLTLESTRVTHADQKTLLTLTSQSLPRCEAAVATVEGAALTGGLDAAMITRAFQRCAAPAKTLELAPAAATRFYAVGLLQPPTTVP